MENKRFLEVIEEHFGVHESGSYIELETHTSGGVNMFITLHKSYEKTYLGQFKEAVKSFGVDEEIDIHRQGQDYKNAFTLRQSLEDFEFYLAELESIVEKLMSIDKEEDVVE